MGVVPAEKIGDFDRSPVRFPHLQENDELVKTAFEARTHEAPFSRKRNQPVPYDYRIWIRDEAMARERE